MSERSPYSPPPMEMLRRLRLGCVVPEPLDPSVAAWLSRSIDRYLARESATLEAALGLSRPHGGLAWWRREAIDARNDALRTLASRHFSHLPVTGRARAIALAAQRYGASAWRHDRARATLPDTEAGTIRDYLFRAFRAGAPMPLSDRQMRNILRSSSERRAGRENETLADDRQ